MSIRWMVVGRFGSRIIMINSGSSAVIPNYYLSYSWGMMAIDDGLYIWPSKGVYRSNVYAPGSIHLHACLEIASQFMAETDLHVIDTITENRI